MTKIQWHWELSSLPPLKILAFTLVLRTFYRNPGFPQNGSLSEPQWVNPLIICRDTEMSISFKDCMTGWLRSITELFGPEGWQSSSTTCVQLCMLHLCVHESPRARGANVWMTCSSQGLGRYFCLCLRLNWSWSFLSYLVEVQGMSATVVLRQTFPNANQCSPLPGNAPVGQGPIPNTVPCQPLWNVFRQNSCTESGISL